MLFLFSTHGYRLLFNCKPFSVSFKFKFSVIRKSNLETVWWENKFDAFMFKRHQKLTPWSSVEIEAYVWSLVHHKHLCCIIEMFLLNFYWRSVYKQNISEWWVHFSATKTFFSIYFIVSWTPHASLSGHKTVETINCQQETQKKRKIV